MPKQTPLHDLHIQAGAQMVDFSGWQMPLHYGSQLVEHRQVRASVGLFDVSHMCILDVSGHDAHYYLRFLLANDINKLKSPGQAFYTCLLNHQGGIIDDLIVYHIADKQFRLIVNAGSRDRVLTWMTRCADRYDILMTERTDCAMLAIQGPDALSQIADVLDVDHAAKQLAELRAFHFVQLNDMMVARTGYTGENGVEIILPAEQAPTLWNNLIKHGVPPCGLGARDTLRLEAGFNLYGRDMTEHTTPLECNLAWTVSWNDPARDFIGKQALITQKSNGLAYQLKGVMMTTRGVLRDRQTLFFSNGQLGEITSGGFSPILGHSIALARIPIDGGAEAVIERRGDKVKVSIVKPPFIRKGQKII